VRVKFLGLGSDGVVSKGLAVPIKISKSATISTFLFHKLISNLPAGVDCGRFGSIYSLLSWWREARCVFVSVIS